MSSCNKVDAFKKKIFHMLFLQNLWMFPSLIILIFYVYFKQLVPRKYEGPIYLNKIKGGGQFKLSHI